MHKRLAALEASQDARLLEGTGSAQRATDRLEELMAQSTDVICEVGADGSVLFVSRNAEELLGEPAERIVGRSVLETAVMGNVHPDDRAALAESFQSNAGAETEGDFVYRYRVRDSWRWFSSRSRAAPGPDGQWHAVIISRDVTEREEALQQLRESEERHRVLVEATNDLMIELDAEGRVLFISPSIQDVLGYAPEEFVGTTPFAMLHPDDVERLAEQFLTRVGSHHRPRLGEVFRAKHRDGSWRWLQGGGVNFETAGGETHVVAVSRDVTERVEADRERERLEERVEQARKFESLGMLATGVAHDFNNLLTPIMGAAGLTLMDLPPDSPLRERLEKIQRAAHQAAVLTNQLLEYSGMGGLDPERVDLDAVLSELAEPLRGAVGRRAHLAHETCDDIPAVLADPGQLGQLVTNLVTNAADAVEVGGTHEGRVTLRTGAAELGEATLAGLDLGDGCKPGRYAWLEIVDDGIGLDDHSQSRIFDPFYTTKYGGRGLGLSVVLGVVRKHRGAVELESSKGRGTRIRVYLPAAR